MCIPTGKEFKVRLNKKGEGWGWKFFWSYNGELSSLLYFVKDFKRGQWIKSKTGPGFFLFPTKKDVTDDTWRHDKILKIKFRGVQHANRWPCDPKVRVIVANEIFIPK